MKIFQADKNGFIKGVEEIATILKNGGVAVLPTDTIYGLACDAANQGAVNRIFQIKGRDKKSTLAVMIAGIGDVYDYAEVGEMEKKYIEEFLPGPVTVILKAKPEYKQNYSENTINNDGAVGFRVIDMKFVQDLCRRFGRPLVLTSANKSKAGRYMADLDFVKDQLAGEMNNIDAIVDKGHLGSHVPSMVIDLTKTPYEIIRYGGDKK